jgi:hypothetical protein
MGLGEGSEVLVLVHERQNKCVGAVGLSKILFEEVGFHTFLGRWCKDSAVLASGGSWFHHSTNFD